MAPAKKEPQLVVQIKKNFKGIDAPSAEIKKLVKSVCRLAETPGKITEITVSIAIVDDDEIRKLNSKFLNRKSTTDCLSFDLSDNLQPQSTGTFELIVNGEMAARQAQKRGHPPRAELALYITHGLLHNFGFDDSTESLAKKMHDTEDKILQQLGYGLVYNKNQKNKRPAS
jgi:probable rRNA maturation factor